MDITTNDKIKNTRRCLLVSNPNTTGKVLILLIASPFISSISLINSLQKFKIKANIKHGQPFNSCSVKANSENKKIKPTKVEIKILPKRGIFLNLVVYRNRIINVNKEINIVLLLKIVEIINDDIRKNNPSL